MYFIPLLFHSLVLYKYPFGGIMPIVLPVIISFS